MEWLALVNKGLARVAKLVTHLGSCDLCLQEIYPTKRDECSSMGFICRYCLADLALFEQEKIKGDLLSWPAVKRALPKCQFDRLFVLSPYLYPFDTWLKQFKYQGRFQLARFLSKLLAREWLKYAHFDVAQAVDLVVAVPVHVSRWQQRGYNQAHLLAKEFAQQAKLPYGTHLLKRVKQNASQVGKSGAERRTSLRGAFCLREPLADGIKHVLIVDDVVTTGSTASEISAVLKRAGVEKVTLVTVCISLPQKC